MADLQEKDVVAYGLLLAVRQGFGCQALSKERGAPHLQISIVNVAAPLLVGWYVQEEWLFLPVFWFNHRSKKYHDANGDKHTANYGYQNHQQNI